MVGRGLFGALTTPPDRGIILRRWLDFLSFFNDLSIFAATKAGLKGFSRSLARETGKGGITVNCVAPGYMETEMMHALQGDKLESLKRRSIIDRMAIMLPNFWTGQSAEPRPET